jgi:hypothetical protein
MFPSASSFEVGSLERRLLASLLGLYSFEPLAWDVKHIPLRGPSRWIIDMR